MTRKKFRFFLSTLKSKRRNRLHTPYKRQSENHDSPNKRVKLQSPLSISNNISITTPIKTKRLLTPASSAKKTKRRLVNTPSKYKENKVRTQRDQEIDELIWFDETSEETTPEENDFIKLGCDKEVLRKLSEARLLHFLTMFLSLVKRDKYPLHNIALLLWLETVKWYNCSTLHEMRFWKVTKDFWRAGYRLFQGKFLCFMNGPRGLGTFLSNNSRRGTLDPMSSEINFAVPSRNTFVDNKQSKIPAILKPGIIHQAIESIGNSPLSKVNMMCLDGKKVTAGLDDKYGDVDMFGYEQSPTLSEQKERLDKEETLINDLKISVEVCQEASKTFNENDVASKKSDIVDMLRALLLILTLRLKEARTLKRKQEYGLEKLKERAGPEWKTSKYIFAISSIQAFLYRVKQFISCNLSNIGKICEIGSKLNDSKSYVSDSVNPLKQNNMFTLKPFGMQEQPVPTNFVKQRNKEWHDIRKLAPVTGSTLHNALGLRTLSLQKQHFDIHILGKEEPEPSEEIKKYFRHGTENEPNAVATLVGKFLPIFHPDLSYFEEGCCLIDGNAETSMRRPLMAVSPDGSLRRFTNNDADKYVAAIEIKCPYPKLNSDTLYYCIPQYYVCQCLTEMKALGVLSMVFVCYTEESSTFFEMDFDEDLYMTLEEQANVLYGNEDLVRPTRKHPDTMEIKKKLLSFCETNVRLLAEIPSAKMTSCNEERPNSNTHSPYFEQISETPSIPEQSIDDILLDLNVTLNESSDCIKNGHQICRRKANEVMVWVLSNKDRLWSAELPNSMIVAFGLKDYKLNVQQLRAATEDVLRECQQAGIDVPVLAFDGQWYQLMVRDDESKPLTKLQLQKDVWNEVTKMKKKEIVDKLINLNKPNMQTVTNSGIEIQNTTGGLIVSSTDHAFLRIRTNRNPKHWKKTTSIENDSNEDIHADGETNDANLNWIPDNVIEAVEKSGDSELLATLNNISKDINQILTAENSNTADEEFEEPVNDIVSRERNENEMNENESYDLNLKDKLHEGDYNDIRSKLTECKRHDKWRKISTDELKTLMTSATKMIVFTKEELTVIINALKSKFESVRIEPKGNWTKEKMINTLCEVLGNGTTVSLKMRIKKIPTLKKMAEKVLRSKLVPKQVLNIAYAQYIFPARLEQWQTNMPFESFCNMKIDNYDFRIEWYSFPEFNRATNGLLCKTLDSHHLLTNLRIRTSTTGLKDISANAWKNVASSFNTNLTPAMVDDLTDKQSNAFARTHFSKEVEDEMIKNEDINEAELCSLVRRWYEAEDEPALSASERVVRWLDLRQYLLKDVDFAVFPPASQQIKGFSLIGFEGFLVGIDTKMQLFHMCGSYCVRTVSSLPAETAVGGIQDMNFNKSMSVKAKDVPRVISALTEVMTYKCNPDRGFFMKTSRSSVYPVVVGSNKSDVLEDSDSDSDTTSTEQQAHISPPHEDGVLKSIDPRDHAFDRPDRRRTKARRKLGGLTSDLDAPPKGTLPMRREFHKCDESKVLPDKRSHIFQEIRDIDI